MYTNVAFGIEESALFIEVTTIQRCPDRERFHLYIVSIITDILNVMFYHQLQMQYQ